MQDRVMQESVIDDSPEFADALPDDTGLSDQVVALSAELEMIDPNAAARLEDLGATLTADPEEQAQLSLLDLSRAFDLAGLEERAAAHYQKWWWLRYAEILRNVLVLIPLLVTWYGLSEATRNYNALVTKSPDLITQPFLLLWERGFSGTGLSSLLTFSTVALFDFGLLFVVVLLSLGIEVGHNLHRNRAFDQAADLRQRLSDTIWLLSRHFAGHRYQNSPDQDAVRLGQVVTQFQSHTTELVNLLHAEHVRLDQLADRRERELGDLAVFSKGLTSGSKELLRHGTNVRTLSDQMQQSIAQLVTQIERDSDLQHQVVTALDNLGTSMELSMTTHRELGQNLQHALATVGQTMAEAQTQMHAVTEAAEQMSRLGVRLEQGEQRLQSALTDIHQANTQVLQGVQLAAQQFGQTAQQSSQVSTRTAEMLQQAISQVGNLQGSHQQMNTRLVGMLQQAIDQIGGLHESQQQLSTVIGQVAQRQTEMTAMLVQTLQDWRGATTQLDHTSQHLQAAVEGFSQGVREARAAEHVSAPSPFAALSPEALAWTHRFWLKLSLLVILAMSISVALAFGLFHFIR